MRCLPVHRVKDGRPLDRSIAERRHWLEAVDEPVYVWVAHRHVDSRARSAGRTSLGIANLEEFDGFTLVEKVGDARNVVEERSRQ